MVARRIRPYPISRYARAPRAGPSHDWVAAPSPEWVAEYESASVEQRYFVVGFRTPPEMPAAVLPTVERYRGDWLFYPWHREGTGTQLQWVSQSYRPPFASWQVFLLRSALRAIQYRQLVASKMGQWRLRGIAAAGLSVGGPLVGWWVITHLLGS